MAFQPIRRILPGALQQFGITRQVTAARVVSEARASLLRLWGEEKSAIVHIVSFSEGALKVEASSSVALHELRALHVRWQNEMNRQLGEQVVKKINLFQAR